jgi:spermidine synthase
MMTRSFFGIYTVQQSGPDARALVHGTTVHGLQNRGSDERERMPTTYYVPESGVGLAMRAAPQLFGERARIGVVGLGTGTLACYARPGQSWRFYEIDPAVADIARDPNRFTFLSRCQPHAPIVIGDARLTLAQAPAASADLLVVDAFSSDSIPMHLLTLEAFAVYRRHLRSNGLLLIHITNRYLDLVPVIAAAAAEQGWSARIRSYSPDEAQRAQNHARSRWVAMSPSAATLARLTSTDERWERLRRRHGFAAWTDSHGSLLPLLHGTQPTH